jgi:hypothetical protein
VAGAGGGDLALRHNKRMHATRDTTAVICINLAGGRVMHGVRLLACNNSRKGFGHGNTALASRYST